jgi:Mu transposase, C-terminal domain
MESAAKIRRMVLRDGPRPHPEQQDQTVDAVFAAEQAELRPLGRPFDGYVEKTVRVRSTCLVHYDSNRYSVPACFAGQRVSLRVYASRIPPRHFQAQPLSPSGVNLALHKGQSRGPYRDCFALV